ncbi:MAG TPA: tetratricopeptide repeat protein, partial [Longimicrobiaceae bacterium]
MSAPQPESVHPACAQLMDRAWAHERAGEWDLALEAYDQAFQRAHVLRSPESLLEVVTRLGHSYRQAGRTPEAVEVLELALEIAERRGATLHAARALNGLGIVRHTHGHLEEAEEAYIRGRELARQYGSDRVVGEIEQNLGIVATIRGDFAEAEARYRAGLASLERAGSERGAASALTNLGVLKVSQGELEQADEFFQRSLEICERTGDVMTAGNVHLNRTELFLALGNPQAARASCDEAYETYSRVGNLEGQAEAMKGFGIIHRTVGKLHLAETMLRQAIQIAAEAPYPRAEADAHRELALVLRALNRNREALEALNRSHTLFIRLQAHTDQADIRERINQLESDFLSLVRFWGESIEAKDRYTSGHCERVAGYACRLASEVGMEE